MHVHAQNHAHPHDEKSSQRMRRLGWLIAMIGTFMVAEIIGGLVSGSLALLADAGHMFSDLLSLCLSLFAAWIVRKPATPKRTFGYHRAEILAALINGSLLGIIAIYIAIEAYHRWQDPPDVRAPLMLAIAFAGLVVNIVGMKMLHSHQGDNLNMRGAYLHMLGDLLGSVGVLIAGVAIWTTGWLWVDPLVSVIIAVLVFYSAWNLVVAAADVLMESAPEHINVDDLRQSILDVPGVENVHDLHVWSITSGMAALSAHVVMTPEVRVGNVLKTLRELIREKFGIEHITIQVEPETFYERHEADQ